jgi:hypothetical protein
LRYKVISGRLRLKRFAEVITQQIRAAPCPKDVVLRNGLCRKVEGERENTCKIITRQNLSN